MLPKNRLGRQMYRKLFVYEGNEHNHEAQKPEKIRFIGGIWQKKVNSQLQEEEKEV